MDADSWIRIYHGLNHGHAKSQLEPEVKRNQPRVSANTLNSPTSFASSRTNATAPTTTPEQPSPPERPSPFRQQPVGWIQPKPPLPASCKPAEANAPRWQYSPLPDHGNHPEAPELHVPGRQYWTWLMGMARSALRPCYSPTRRPRPFARVHSPASIHQRSR